MDGWLVGKHLGSGGLGQGVAFGKKELKMQGCFLYLLHSTASVLS